MFFILGPGIVWYNSCSLEVPFIGCFFGQYDMDVDMNTVKYFNDNEHWHDWEKIKAEYQQAIEEDEEEEEEDEDEEEEEEDEESSEDSSDDDSSEDDSSEDDSSEDDEE